MSSETHPLQSSWTFWMGDANEKDWKKKLQPVCDFTTVEDFWANFNHLPKPGRCFFDGESRASVGDDNKVIDEICVFKTGIRPEWEDPQNKDGGCFYVRKQMEPDQADIYWQNTVLAMIGEALDEGDEIAGARMVDKGKNFPLYRFELWLKTSDSNHVRNIKESFNAALTEGPNTFSKGHPKWDWKKHSK
jgi:hypothetical protein